MSKTLKTSVCTTVTIKKTLKTRLTSVRLAIVSFFMRIIGVDLYLKNQATILTNQMNTLRTDMKTLYGEISTDTRRELKKIGNIKPILKIEDPEAVKFIKDILSVHDKKIQTQQEFLEMKKINLDRLESSVDSKLLKLEELYVNLTEALKFDKEDKKEG